MSTELQPSYFAIIPADVRYCKEVCANAKLLYGEISALTNKYGFCYASNQYFADLYEVDKTTVSKWVSSLVKAGFIRIEVIDRVERKIFLTIDKKTIEDRQKSQGGIGEKAIEDREKRQHISTVNNTINNKEKEEERALEIPIKQNFQDPFIPKHDFDGANLVWKVLTKNAIENYKTAIPSDPTHCSAIFQLLISDDKESELGERLLQYEYSWFGENKKTPNAKNVFKSWDQLTPGKVPYYIREGFKTENECLSARRKKAEEKKEEAKPNIDWQALKKKEEERVKQVLAILGETQGMVNGTN